jgi:hypothetical protein
MARPVPSRERTLTEQAFQLDRDFPDGKAKLRPAVLVWTGRLTPTPLSREYTVRIWYARGHYPGVRLVEPPLRPDERELLHHLYPNGDLCLHKVDEWDPSMLLVDTIIPWTAEWLAHYELWKLNHQWYGDGEEAEGAAPSSNPEPTPGPQDNRPRDGGKGERAVQRRRHPRRR